MRSILWLCFAVLACVGLIQVVTWIAVRLSRKGNKVYRIVPIGGAGKKCGDQMSLFYACVQWEANPSGQQYILYDAGLDEETAKSCQLLANSVGVYFVRDAKELESILRK